VAGGASVVTQLGRTIERVCGTDIAINDPMMKLWPALLLLGACLVGDGSIDDGDDPVNVPPNDNPNAVRCSAGFQISGSFAGAARPTDVAGCWPVGTWTFTATLDSAAEVLDINGDGTGERCGAVAGTTPPALEASYSFTVTHAEDTDAGGTVETYAYNGSSPNLFGRSPRAAAATVRVGWSSRTLPGRSFGTSIRRSARPTRRGAESGATT
jgi:hypothetical protein